MDNCYSNKSQNITNIKVIFIKDRFQEAIRDKRLKEGKYNLEILASEENLNMNYNYLRKIIWKEGFHRDYAEKIADKLGVRLEWLEGTSNIKTKKELEDLERKATEQNKRADNMLFSSGLEYFKLLPNINITFVENINDDTNEQTNGYKITYRDKNYNESAPIYKSISEMKDFLQNMNEIIEQIIILHTLK